MKKHRRRFIKQAAFAAVAPWHIAADERVRLLSDPIDDIPLCLAYFFGFQEHRIQLSKQMGVTGVVAPASPHLGGLQNTKPWDLETLQAIKARFAKEGMTWRVLEGTPPLDKVKLGLDGRDEEIENFFTLMRNMKKIGLDTICYNWMPVISWHRTSSDKKGRGGALVTAFDYEEIKDQPLTEYGEFTSEMMWNNITYFLKAVVPEAEKNGIKLALHPDDPPVPSIRGISRIMISADAFKRLIDIVPSPNNGLTLCQGTFATMGEDIPSVIDYFGKRNKIFFVHFRDIQGTPNNFEETFHDEGKTDMFAAMKGYFEVGFKGPMRPDHVPTVAGDSNQHPGYSTMGTLFAIGYIKGLMEAAKKTLG